MPLMPPTNEDLAEIAGRYRLGLGPGDIEQFREIITGAVASYDAVERLYEASRPEPPDRPYRWPDAAENELGAWYVTTELRTAEDGPLAGRILAPTPPGTYHPLVKGGELGRHERASSLDLVIGGPEIV